MKLLELAQEWPSLKIKLELKKEEDLGGTREIIEKFFRRELAKLPEDKNRLLTHLAWFHYPGFFSINFTLDDYNRIFPKDGLKTVSEDSVLQKYVKSTVSWESKMNPLLTFYYTHYVQGPDEKIIQEIQKCHKEHGNPAYLFWYIYQDDMESFYQKCTYFLSTLSIFYGPDDEQKETMKELFFNLKDEILLLYYPWIFGESLESYMPLYESEFKQDPYGNLFAIKYWLLAHETNPEIFKFLRLLFNEFRNRRDHQAMMDAYRLYLIFGLAIYGFESSELLKSIKELQDEIDKTIIDKISDIEKEFLLMEENVVNRFSDGDTDYSAYQGLYNALLDDKAILDKRQKILILSVAKLLALSPKLKGHLKKWCEVLRENQVEGWSQEILESQSELWQAIALDDKEALANLVWDLCTGGQLPTIPVLPEVKIILKLGHGEIIWQSNSIKLGSNDTKILRAIGYGEKTQFEIREEINKKPAAIKKAIQRLREKLKGSPLAIECKNGVYFLLRNREWVVRWIDEVNKNQEG